jgi:hypothetical protein
MGLNLPRRDDMGLVDCKKLERFSTVSFEEGC